MLDRRQKAYLPPLDPRIDVGRRPGDLLAAVNLAQLPHRLGPLGGGALRTRRLLFRRGGLSDKGGMGDRKP
jgi:hypothetical protein